MSGFWTTVEQARAAAAADGTSWPGGSRIGAALTDLLSQLPPERIVAFDRCHSRAVRQAHQWGVCAAALVIWDHISDDGFSDFKSGLVGLGRGSFDEVVADPDALADHPMVQAIAAGRLDRFALGGEAIKAAASTAYERVTGDADGFWEALESRPAETGEDPLAPAAPWSGTFGSPDDAARIPVRLPRLHRLFKGDPTDAAGEGGRERKASAPVRRPHPTHRCPVCDAPLSLHAATKAGYDESGALAPRREFRRCVQCPAISARDHGTDAWQAIDLSGVPDRVRSMVSLL